MKSLSEVVANPLDKNIPFICSVAKQFRETIAPSEQWHIAHGIQRKRIVGKLVDGASLTLIG